MTEQTMEHSWELQMDDCLVVLSVMTMDLKMVESLVVQKVETLVVPMELN